MRIRREVNPFIFSVVVVALLVGVVLVLAGVSGAVAAWIVGPLVGLLGCYMIYFFRDPQRVVPADPLALVAGADGKVMCVCDADEPRYLGCRAVRISIFLSLFDVHVNRAPMRGAIKSLDYVPGARFFTFQEKSSDRNEHNSILIENGASRCLVNQIVGPFCRRVVHWLQSGQSVEKGERIGMMKFGSRLDMYFPKDDVTVVARQGDVARAGETVVAVLRKESRQ